MGLREDIKKKIEKKRDELRGLQLQIDKGEAYIQALVETLKMLPKEGTVAKALRAGSDVAKARDALRRAGKALHIGDILKGIGKPNDKKNRVSLSGTIAHYVRRNEVFTRPAPNTYGLIEFDKPDAEDDGGSDEDNIEHSANGEINLN